MISVGSLSLLVGVHQVFFHPLTVGIAWKGIHGVWPKWWEWVAVFLHDVGYWGCKNMDGPEGRRHPVRGADLAFTATYQLRFAWLSLRHPTWTDDFRRDDAFWFAERTRKLSLGHSRFYAKAAGIPVSKLFAADKASIYFDPKFFYLFRAHLSGEIFEYIASSEVPEASPAEWHSWYVRIVGQLL